MDIGQPINRTRKAVADIRIGVSLFEIPLDGLSSESQHHCHRHVYQLADNHLRLGHPFPIIYRFRWRKIKKINANYVGWNAY